MKIKDKISQDNLRRIFEYENNYRKKYDDVMEQLTENSDKKHCIISLFEEKNINISWQNVINCESEEHFYECFLVKDEYIVFILSKIYVDNFYAYLFANCDPYDLYDWLKSNTYNNIKKNILISIIINLKNDPFVLLDVLLKYFMDDFFELLSFFLDYHEFDGDGDDMIMVSSRQDLIDRHS